MCMLSRCFYGAGERSRTSDLLITNQAVKRVFKPWKSSRYRRFFLTFLPLRGEKPPPKYKIGPDGTVYRKTWRGWRVDK